MNLKSNFKDSPNSTFLVELEIPAEELDNQFDTLVKKYSSTLSLPGFRKGKIPPSIVEKKFGEEISHSVLEEIVPKAIEQVIKDHSLEVIGPATLDKDHPPLKYENQKPLNMKLVFNKKPTCEIKSYEGLAIVKTRYRVGEEDIQDNRKKILDSLGKSIEVEEALDGDMIHLNLDFSDPAFKSFNLVNHIAVFEEGGKNAYPEYLTPLYAIIKKMKKGDSQELTFAFPNDTSEEKLRGQSLLLSIQVTRISRFQAAELNQETLERLKISDEKELMEKIKQDMEEHAEDQALKHNFTEAVNALKKNAVFQIPEIAVNYFLESSWNQLVEDLQARGQKNLSAHPPEAWVKENRDLALKQIESDLVISQVREKEKIEVGEEELENKIKSLAEMAKMDIKEYRKELIRSGGFTEVKRQMGHRKTLEWILAQCRVSKEEEIPYRELQKHHH